MKIELDKRFKKNVAGKFGQYQFEVGIIDDGPHKKPRIGERGQKGADVLSQFAGGPIRKKTSVDSGKTISQVSKEFREHTGTNYLVEPFKKRDSDIIRFSNEFFKYVFGRSEGARLRNLLQAIVRNPVLRGDYGNNSATTKKIKGFDRFGIDTAQLFKAIKSRILKKG